MGRIVWFAFLALLCGGHALNHPKLRKRSTFGPVNRHLADRYLVIWKSDEATIENVNAAATISEVTLEKVLNASSSGGGGGDGGATPPHPKVKVWKENGVGVTAEMNEDALNKVLELEEVAMVEEDMEVSGAVDFYPLRMGWHLDRIDQRSATLDRRYLPPFTGRGVDIYIFDSGISYTHRVFGGRASFGGYDFNATEGRRGSDCHGHGTHCAGLAGGETVGVAPDANLYSIRVLNCGLGGTFSWVLEALDHVVRRKAATGRPTVVSMSLIGPHSVAVDSALRRAFASGILVFVAAGNQRSDACQFSPSSSNHAVTVGATQQSGDRLYWFDFSDASPGTNYGRCVNIFAPGQWIQSATHLNDRFLVINSGTSMAVPIAAGVAALFLEEDPSLGPLQLWQRMQGNSTKGAIDLSPVPESFQSSTPNLLVFSRQGVPQVTTQSTPAVTTVTAVPVDDLTANLTTATPSGSDITPTPNGDNSTTQFPIDDLTIPPPTNLTTPTTPPPTTPETTPTTPETTPTNLTTPINLTTPTTPETTPTTPETTPTTPETTPTTQAPLSNLSIPLTSPLPNISSRLLDAIRPENLYPTIIWQKKSGFVPVKIGIYRVFQYHYYSVVFKYVGAANVSQYLTWKDLTFRQAYDLIEARRRMGMAPIALAPYNNAWNDPRITLVFKHDPPLAQRTVVSMEMTISRLGEEERSLKSSGYSMAYRRLRNTGVTDSNTAYARVHTIYRQDFPTTSHGSLTESSLQPYIDRQANSSQFLIDVGAYDYRGTQLFHAIFSSERFGSGDFRTLSSPGRSSLARDLSSLRERDYHVVAFVDLPQRYPHLPKYFTAFWRS